MIAFIQSRGKFLCQSLQVKERRLTPGRLWCFSLSIQCVEFGLPVQAAVRVMLQVKQQTQQQEAAVGDRLWMP